MSRLRSRVLLAAGSSSLLLSILAIADTTAATPEPGAVQILPPGESVGRPLPPLGVPLAERRPTFGYSAAATVPINNDELLPEGVYRTPEVTRDQQIATAVNAGFAEEDVNAFLGAGDPADTYVIGLRLADGGWTQLVSYNGGAEEVGWRGTYEVIDEDTVVATDPCGSITYTYAFDGEQLTLDMIDDQCDGVEEQIAQTIIFETAPFTLVEAASGDDTPTAPATYTSTSFVVPFEVTLPGWVAPEPAVTEANFVTWEGTDADRGIRFLAPVNLYPPGSTTTTPLPDDYVSYLMSQAEHGAIFSDVVETTIDGLPATVVTATTDHSIDGGLGCQAEGLAAEDCFGLQPDLSLRLAVVEVGDHPLLIWVRDINGVDAEYDTFDAMLSSLQFGEPADISDQPAASTSEVVESSASTPPQST